MEGFTFFKNSGKSGPGISKNQKKTNGFSKFFEIYFRKFWKLLELNLLYFICCIPVVTFGPATAAFTKVMKNYSQQRNVFLLSDFFEAFKKNFKQSIIIGLVDVMLIISFIVSIPYYSDMAQKSGYFILVLAISVCTLLMLIMMHFYIYIMIVSTTLKLSQIIKNSLILAISELEKNAITLFMTLLIIAPFVLFFPYSISFIPFLPLSILGLAVCINTYPIVRKQVIQPFYDKKGQLNPEFQYDYPDENSSTIFTDNGGNELPVDLGLSSKGKTIR